jgi:hypothetical protein
MATVTYKEKRDTILNFRSCIRIIGYVWRYYEQVTVVGHQYYLMLVTNGIAAEVLTRSGQTLTYVASINTMAYTAPSCDQTWNYVVTNCNYISTL